jgi:hypothetical protein
MRDVIPCVTSLRKFPKDLKALDDASFRKHFVNAGERCWLIKSNTNRLSTRMATFLSHVPEKLRQTYTCLHQDPWYNYEEAPIPCLLFQSGFNHFGPKVAVNSIGAQAVGSVYGIHGIAEKNVRSVRKYLASFNFEARVVAHAKTLKKVEVRQLNAVLSAWKTTASK